MRRGILSDESIKRMYPEHFPPDFRAHQLMYEDGVDVPKHKLSVSSGRRRLTSTAVRLVMHWNARALHFRILLQHSKYQKLLQSAAVGGKPMSSALMSSMEMCWPLHEWTPEPKSSSSWRD